MKRVTLLLVLAALVLPAGALAKGPSKATIDGPGLGKAITITGEEEAGSPLMTFAEQAGFFPAVFSQTPDPMLPKRPSGNLGPKYSVEYTVPGPEGETYTIDQELYPYAQPSAVTYMRSGQEIFEIPDGTRGGWFQDAALRDTLVAAGLPAKPVATATESSFFSGGRLGALAGAAALLIAIGSVAFMRRRHPGTTA